MATLPYRPSRVAPVRSLEFIKDIIIKRIRGRIRGGSGLGDSIYLRPLVEQLIAEGERVTVCSDYPDVFIGTGATVEPFGRHNIQVLAHYSAFKSDPDTNQWQDICRSARMTAELRSVWTVRNTALVEKLRTRAFGRKIILVHGGRAPMGRTDGFGAELLPEAGAFTAALEALQDCLLVRIGKGAELYPLPTEINLNGSTSVSDLLDVGSICAGVVAQCSFAVPLAEVFDKPLLAIWAARGLTAREAYVRQIAPKKILSKPTSHFVVDDWPLEQIQEVVGVFRG